MSPLATTPAAAGRVVLPLLLLSFSVAATAEELPQRRETPEAAVVRAAVAAFNAHDPEAFAALCADDARWFGVAGDSVSVDGEGRESIRDWLVGYFASLPDVRSEVSRLTQSGRHVAFRERVTWTASDGTARTQEALAVYEVRDGEIRRAWYFSTTPGAGDRAAAMPGGAPAPAAPDPSADRILLVRHAEAEGTAAEAALTDAGRQRAAALAGHLAAEPIVAVLATDTRRALDTAAPVAAAHRLEVELYDHRALAELAEELRGRAGTLLVVGHSNTTPDLVRLLGGDPGEPIAHDEHDRLYRVDGATGATTLDRFAVTPR